mgnify:CR=1 FL=1|jgi:hypothetical protein
MLRIAKNGSSCDIKFLGKTVYINCRHGNISINSLGIKLDKNEWLINNIKHKHNLNSVNANLMDWQLYENGWYVSTYNKTSLFNYLCDIGSSSIRPIELDYLHI